MVRSRDRRWLAGPVRDGGATTDDVVARLRAPAACSPRTRRGCCGAPARRRAARRWSRGGWPGEPLEQVVGWAEFCGLRVAVEPGVFVPRLRTRAARRQAIALAAPGAVVVDLCCGSGALGAASPPASRHVELHAADVDPAAVRCARRNLAAAAARARGRPVRALPRGLRGRVDVLVANVPYVPTGESRSAAEAREHEPRRALDGGADGLDVLRRVAARGAGVARARRLCAVRDQRAAGAHGPRRLPAAGLATRVAEDDERGATVVVGTRRA